MDLWRIPRQRGRRVITNLVILSPILRRIMMMIMRGFHECDNNNTPIREIRYPDYTAVVAA